jgi:hypothetical protein
MPDGSRHLDYRVFHHIDDAAVTPPPPERVDSSRPVSAPAPASSGSQDRVLP